jgi:hypothetical protein
MVEMGTHPKNMMWNVEMFYMIYHIRRYVIDVIIFLLSCNFALNM